MADKNLIKLKAGDKVTPILYAMSLSDENAELAEVPSDPITLKEDFKFEETDLGDGTFAFMFEVVDTANKTVDSEANYLTE